VILVDANLLVYAYVKNLPQHPLAFEWLGKQFRNSSRVALPWPSLLAFVRLVSNPRIFKSPVTVPIAWDQVELWLSQPCVWSPWPTAKHAEVLGQLLRQAKMGANSVPDAHLAALAIEYDLTLCTSDNGFSRFENLRWQNPMGSGSSVTAG
jgi:toxin-antitoxin system PIN domain toxin